MLQSSLRELTLGFFRTGMIVLFLKHEGTTDNSRERLKMSVKTSASTSAAWYHGVAMQAVVQNTAVNSLGR